MIAKFNNLEKEFVEFVLNKYGKLIIIIFASFLAILIHKSSLLYQSGDWITHYSLWYNDLKANGGLLALGKGIGDYPPGFNLLLVLLTYLPISPADGFKWGVLIFDFIAAITSYFSIKELNKSSNENKYLPSITYAIILLMPSIFLNTSVWGQVDAIYISIILLAIYFIIKENYGIAFFIVGISLSLKQTAIFIFPTLGILYLRKKQISLLHFVNIFLGYLFISLPALILGGNIFKPYLGFGTGITGVIVANFTNIYYLFTPDPIYKAWVSSEMYTKIGTYFCIFVLGALILLMYYKKANISGSNIFLVTAMFAVVICNLLPGIHDRYMLLGDITSILYILSSKRYKDIWIPAFINFTSVYSIINYLRGLSDKVSDTRIILMQIVSISFLFISSYFVYYVIKIIGKSDSNL